jgi:catechol 2,3-dioxygenase-like lactoylglutathione lyase family enzyme
MIGYATVGVNDLERARSFYDALMGVVDAKRLMSMPDAQGMTLYGTGMDRPMVAITKPYDGGAATPGNGAMIALAADSREQVDRLHAKAVELGGADEGAPGLRQPEEMGFYGAYWRDPDGNKFCAFKLG